jgi:hypothetical protein
MFRDPGNGMGESLQRIALELVRAVGHVLIDLGVSILFLGAGALLLLAVVTFLSAFITPVGILVGFVTVTTVTYLYIRLIQSEGSR